MTDPRPQSAAGATRTRRFDVQAILNLVLGLPGRLWRPRRSLAVAALSAPLALGGSPELFAINGLALRYAAFMALRLARAK